MFTDWLEKIEGKYKIKVTHTRGENYFNADIYNFSDPHDAGLPFTVVLNDEGSPSTFNTPLFQFKHFNIAEYVDSGDILVAAERCLEGELIIDKTLFGKYKLTFDLASFKGSSESVGLEDIDRLKAYEKL